MYVHLLAFTAEDWTAVGGMVLAMLGVAEGGRRGYRFVIGKIEERGAKRERDKQTLKEEQERDAKLFAAATMINAMDGKLTAHANLFTDTLNTKLGNLEAQFNAKMDDHETRDQARQEEIKVELAAIKKNGNGH